MKKVTLRVNGQDMAFSEKELIAIVEKHLSRKTTQKTAEVVQKPTEGKWFEVKPQSIDQKLFERKREDRKQEAARQLILEAFAEMNGNPEKYGRRFHTMMPKKTWLGSIIVGQLEEIACKLGDHNADWVEQALEWAQRIANGEPWEAVCNKADKANWYRLVVWKNGYARLIGGSHYTYDSSPASDVGHGDFGTGGNLSFTVPLVVLYKVTLRVNGQEMAFSKKELIAIIEEHLSETTQQTNTAKVAQKPTEDEWFEVKPLAIDQNLFRRKKKDPKQEAIRELILEAFAKMEENPERYGKRFKTMMPKKTWSPKTVGELEEMANNLGDHNANWVEQVLEWAQRIANGESWEAICNDKDTANWYRLVLWKKASFRLVGGSVCNGDDVPVSDVHSREYGDYHVLDYTVPLVVLYE